MGQAGTIKFIGPCSKKPIFKTKLSHVDGISVGKATISTLKAFSIPHKGTETGINSIFDTPTGIDAMEVLSDKEMMAHGWCYSVNNHEPHKYPHEIVLKQGDDILWWFGYAHYKNGKWITQCLPTHTRKPKQFCQKKKK